MWAKKLPSKSKHLSMLVEETPIKMCPECKEESFLTHSRKGYNWCYKCGHMQTGKETK